METISFKTIVADPPWSYRNKRVFGKFRNKNGYVDGGAESQYKSMDLQDIKELPVERIASKNSVLFLWATTPLLPEAFEVMSAWGYQYKTAIYWRKIMSLGMGFWFRGQVELCLFGIRGKVKAFRCQKCNFIQSKVRKHSQKPDEFFDLINPVAPCPKIELFAREQRIGWDVWGNEIVSKKEIAEALRHPATNKVFNFSKGE